MLCVDSCLPKPVEELASQAAQAMLMLEGGLESPPRRDKGELMTVVYVCLWLVVCS